MDANFLEFFGQMLIQTAKGKRQMEQFSNWMQQGINATSMAGFSDHFQRIYGLTNISKESDQYIQLYKKAQADFFAAYGEFMGLMGLVSEKKYKTLRREYESLSKKCRSQEKMIAKLTAKLNKGENPSIDLTDQLADIIEKQKSEFAKTVKSLGKVFDSSKKE